MRIESIPPDAHSDAHYSVNTPIDRIVSQARKKFYGSVRLTTGEVEVLLFADDLMMMAESEEALQHNMQELNDRLEEWEMKANWQKTRVMRIGRKKDVCTVEVNGQEVKQVEVMKYLGVMISSDGSMDSEVEQRIGMASKMIGAIGRTVLGRKELTKDTKVRVVNAMVIPTLTYGCEAWTLQARPAQGTNRGGTDEGIKKDRGGFQNG